MTVSLLIAIVGALTIVRLAGVRIVAARDVTQPCERPLQFSLGRLFLVMTIVAACLAAIAQLQPRDTTGKVFSGAAIA